MPPSTGDPTSATVELYRVEPRGRGRDERPHPVRRAVAAAFWLAVVALVGLAVAVVGVPMVAGATALTVETGSMEPTLPVGTAVVVRPQAIDSIGPGDVITYVDPEAGGRLVTHRVIAVEPGPRFVTQGDANEDPDANTTAAADVRGVLWYQIPWVGSVRDLVLSPAGAMYAGGVVLLLVAGHLLVPRRVGRAQR